MDNHNNCMIVVHQDMDLLEVMEKITENLKEFGLTIRMDHHLYVGDPSRPGFVITELVGERITNTNAFRTPKTIARFNISIDWSAYQLVERISYDLEKAGLTIKLIDQPLDGLTNNSQAFEILKIKN